MESIRFNLEENALSLLDLVIYLTGRSKTKIEKRLSEQAKNPALTHLSQALLRTGISFTRERRKISPSVASPQELVHILHELRLHNSLASTKGGKHVSASELSQRTEDFLAKFANYFPGLWVACDLRSVVFSPRPARALPPTTVATPSLLRLNLPLLT